MDKQKNKNPQPVRWGLIGAVFVTVIAGRFIFGAFQQASQSKSNLQHGMASAAEFRRAAENSKQEIHRLLRAKPVAIDIYSSGKIVVDGSRRSLAETEKMLADMIGSGRPVSIYREPQTLADHPDALAASRLVYESDAPLHDRNYPADSDTPL